MTVYKVSNRKDYTASGGTTFAFDFKIYAETDLYIYVDGVLKALGTDYTVSGGPTWTESGGNVIFVIAPQSGATVTILRLLPLTQGTHWPEGDPFPSASHEDAADRLIMIAQQFNEAIGRVFKVEVSSLLNDIEVPVGSGKLIGWNAAADAIALYNQIIDTGVITTEGDLIQGGTDGIAERLAKGGVDDILMQGATKSAWKTKAYLAALLAAITKLDDLATPDDNTDLDASISKHGLMPKADKIKLNNLKRKIMLPASVFESRVAAGWAAFTQIQGTNFDFGEFDFDASSDEKIISPPIRFTNWNAGNITVRIGWKANATTGNVMWIISFVGRDTTTPEVFDSAFTDHAMSAEGAPGTAEYLKESVWTGSVSELANNDLVLMKITRDADNGSDTLTVDAKLLYVEIEITEA
jgi:hypothetical protein